MIVITQQIKAARALVGWAQQDLAVKAGIAISTIRRIEGLNGPICANFGTIAKIRRVFEEAGVNFAGDPCPGVNLVRSQENGFG
jgi:predicted transcriptional regulator